MTQTNTKKIEVFDTTLRDGAQARGISFSVTDKIAIVQALDAFGVDLIEAGNPGSNPKDLEFFQLMRDIKLQRAQLVAFGSTRRKDVAPADDPNLQSLLQANTDYVAIFGKCWDFHVTEIIKTSLDNNLQMIRDTVAWLVAQGKKVVFDAEHFFDGYKHNADYAIQALQAAKDGGAITLTLCDTNGGCFPEEISRITADVVSRLGDVVIGIHTHNDMGLGVANAIAAADAGVRHIQGTFIGFGERCGNANLSTIIANLQLKKGYQLVPAENLPTLTTIARQIGEIANVSIDEGTPYVGNNAFAHKGGMHIDGVAKASESFEHVDPSLVGNTREFLLSEVAGRSTILEEINKVDPDIQRDSPETRGIITKLKELEYQGYQFEGAKASFDLVIRQYLGQYQPFFELVYFDVKGNYTGAKVYSTAVVKVIVNGQTELAVAEGDGPVNALDSAIRVALERFYPALNSMYLIDYKVRVLKGEEQATASKVRVLIESSDGQRTWTTIGVSTDIVAASWKALVDSIEYKLLMTQ